ncbi:hypothetical protein EC9_29770 [Rosistilla ulvae]|uniref:Uncharacterized protein n=1 Tax=Rosistilla ulvae TaxID=1930277 RepID=A0A517M1M9_9BACT|nr:hypothetical protein EC9_29770 [Rosistilla ulvae]
MSRFTANLNRTDFRSIGRTIGALFLMTLLVGCGSESSTSTVGSDASERQHAEPRELIAFTTAIHNYSNTVSIDQ